MSKGKMYQNIKIIWGFQSKWSAEALESLKMSCEPEAHIQGEFDKLDNPLLNGLGQECTKD